MCIILYNETGKPYDHEKLSIAYDNNPHGLGIMWVEDGKVQTLRGLYSKAKMFEILSHFEGIPHAIHLRWRTRGKIVKDSCHPFRASHKGADHDVFMMHNGTFYGLGTHGGDESDTQVFARKMRKVTAEHGTDVIFTESFIRKIEKEIMSYNKVLFLRSDGTVAILNPSEWTVIDGIWMSNTYSFKKGYRKGTVKESLTTRIATKLTTQGAKASRINGEPADDWYAKSMKWEASRSKGKGGKTSSTSTASKTGKGDFIGTPAEQKLREEVNAAVSKGLKTPLLPPPKASSAPGSSVLSEDLGDRVTRRRRLPNGETEVRSLTRSLPESDLTSEELAKMEEESKPKYEYDYSVWQGYSAYDEWESREARQMAFGTPAGSLPSTRGYDTLEAALRAAERNYEDAGLTAGLEADSKDSPDE